MSGPDEGPRVAGPRARCSLRADERRAPPPPARRSLRHRRPASPTSPTRAGPRLRRRPPLRSRPRSRPTCPGPRSSATRNGTPRGMPSRPFRTATRRARRSATLALASRSPGATPQERCRCSWVSRGPCRCSPTTWRAVAPRPSSSVGPFEEAGEWFAMRVSPGPQLDAARAFEKAHDPRRARAAADRVVASERKTRDEEAEARALRVRLADPPSDAERADARWLATQGADLPAAADALALAAKLDPKHPLTSEELMARARVLSDAGRLDEALHSIDLAAAAPGADKLTNLSRERARGMALYRARGRCERGGQGPHGVRRSRGRQGRRGRVLRRARPLARRPRRRGDPWLRGRAAAFSQVALGRASRVLRAVPADAPRRVDGVRPRLRRVLDRPLRRARRARRVARRSALQAPGRRDQGVARNLRRAGGGRAGSHRELADGRHGGARGAARRRPHARRRSLDGRRALAAR